MFSSSTKLLQAISALVLFQQATVLAAPHSLSSRAPHPPKFISPASDATLTYGRNGELQLKVDYIDGEPYNVASVRFTLTSEFETSHEAGVSHTLASSVPFNEYTAEGTYTLNETTIPAGAYNLTAQELDTNGKPNGLVLSETIFLAPSDSSSGSCNRMMMAKRAPHPPQFVSPSMDDTLTYGSDGKVELNVDYVDGEPENVAYVRFTLTSEFETSHEAGVSHTLARRVPFNEYSAEKSFTLEESTFPAGAYTLTAQELDKNGKPNGAVLSETIFLAPAAAASRK